MRQDRLFERRWRVLVETGTGGTDMLAIDGLRVAFKVKKTLKPEPNTCEVSVTNLNPDTRARLRGKAIRVVLQAGYVASIGTIFSGHARTIDHLHDGPDWVTRIQCGDGEGTGSGGARTGEAFGGGTSLPDKLQKLAGAMGVDSGNLTKKLAADPAAQRALSGHTSHGNAAREMDRILKRLGLEWSIQDGRLQLLKPGESTDDEAVLLSASTGMIGSPEHAPLDKKGGPTPVKIKSLLQPVFRPGRKVQLDAEATKGLFAIDKLSHTGDSEGNDWYSELELLPTTGTAGRVL